MLTKIALLLAVTAATFRWPVPEGWKAETLAFPLDFAKDLTLTGVEELRFAPGMFKPEMPSFWSYSFVWWLDGRPEMDQAQLEATLTRYYAGLCTEVGKENKFTFDPKRFATTLRAEPGPLKKEGHEVHAFAGTVALYDAFVTGKPINLRVVVWVWDCDVSGKRAVFVQASSKARGAPIWNQLDTRRDEFDCH